MATTLDAVQSAVSDVAERLKAMPKALTQEEIGAIVRQNMDAILAEPEAQRKMRWGVQADPAPMGTKYHRFGLTVGDVEWLYDLMCSARGHQRVDGSQHPGPSEDLTKTFNAISSAMFVSQEEIRQIDGKALDNLFPRIPKNWLTSSDAALQASGRWEQMDAYKNARKAMDSAESGFGSQLIGATYVGELWESARRMSTIADKINSFEMKDPTAYLPVEVDFPEMLFVAENTANNSSDYTTVKTGSQRATVAALKFIIHQMWSGELEEDSIIPFIPFIRMQAAKSLSYYGDSLILNGDTTNAGTGNINLDDADPADTKHYLALDGIRHASLVDATGTAIDAGGVVTWAHLRNQRSKMIDTTYKTDWGHPVDPNDLLYVCDPFTLDQIELLPEVLTADKYKDNATVITGEVAKIGRNPIIPHMAVSKTEADGKVSTTGSNNVKGQVVTFNRNGFVRGWRRRVKVEVERLPGRDQTRLVYSLRQGLGRFSPTGAASGITAASVLYNITLP